MPKTIRLTIWPVALLLSTALTGCFEPAKTGVSYTAHNHTDKSIVSIIVNGEGGILHATKHAGGAQVCCVVLPNKWRPGLKSTIKWQEGGSFHLDKNGHRTYENGIPIVIEGPWKEQAVEVPEYDEQTGQFQIHFFAGDEVKVVVGNYMPGHLKYPLSIPDEDK